jgi:hypothetical protein
LLDIVYGEGNWGIYDSFAQRVLKIEEESRPIHARYFARLTEVLVNPYPAGSDLHKGFEECRIYMRELLTA